MADEEAIRIDSLTKKFNSFTAVDSVTLSIKKGEIFGLLGPNGAGKTTTMSMLATILKPTSGSASVCGHDIIREEHSVRKSIGIVFQDTTLDDELTGKENLFLHGRLYGMNPILINKRREDLLKVVELEAKEDSQVKTYSGGMKRRLEIARGLLHNPEVLFLDEPTVGLDPQTRRKLWDYIKEFNRKEKITIILTTHYMEEADFLCDRIAIIDHGRIIALNTTEKLKDVLGGDIITVETKDAEKLKVLLKKESYAKHVHSVERSVNVTVYNAGKTVAKVIELAQTNKVAIDSVLLKRPSLEDVFIHYTGRRIREEEADNRQMMMRFRMRGR